MKKLIQIGFLVAFANFFFACSSPKDKLVKEISEKEQKLYKDTVAVKDIPLAKEVKSMYLKFADDFPADTLAATYLFKAADLSIGLNDAQSATQILERMMAHFPSHPRAASALFYQAFIYDTYLHNSDSAKIKYRIFLEKFPTDQMATSAQASLMQLEAGLSDEDLVKMFQAKNDSLEALAKEHSK